MGTVPPRFKKPDFVIKAGSARCRRVTNACANQRPSWGSLDSNYPGKLRNLSMGSARCRRVTNACANQRPSWGSLDSNYPGKLRNLSMGSARCRRVTNAYANQRPSWVTLDKTTLFWKRNNNKNFLDCEPVCGLARNDKIGRSLIDWVAVMTLPDNCKFARQMVFLQSPMV